MDVIQLGDSEYPPQLAAISDPPACLWTRGDRSMLSGVAVAYEHEGQLAKARDAYEKALRLEPNNALVRQNYDLFKEINDRAAQKDGR